MDAWMKETLDLMKHFFDRATPMETYVVIALCVLLGAFALSAICTRMGSLSAFYLTAIVLVSAGLVLLIGALALPPVLGLKAGWAPVATAALGFLVFVVPFSALFQKGSYVSTLIAWTVAVLITGAVLTLEPRVKHSFEHFKSDFESGKLFGRGHTGWELKK